MIAVLCRLADVERGLPGDPGFLYSNLGFGLLGQGLAHRAGMDYEQLVVTRICDPLHMNITEGTAPFITHLVQHADRPITLKQLGNGQAVIGGGWPAE